MRAMRWVRRVGWRHAVGLFAAAFSLFPIVFVLSAALNPLGTLNSTSAIPNAVTGENFADLFRTQPFESWYLNSVLIAGLASLAAVSLSMLAAYAFSRMRFRGRRVGCWHCYIVGGLTAGAVKG